MVDLVVRNLVAIGLALAALLAAAIVLRLVERLTSGFVSRRLGWNAVLVTGWIGVSVHELSHLAMSHVFGHRIVAWKLFAPDPTTGTLGYVRHAPSRHTLWQTAGEFFIGMAPLVGGGMALAVLAVWMTPGSYRFAVVCDLSADLQATLAQLRGGFAWATLAAFARRLLLVGTHWVTAVWHARTWWLPLQAYLCIAIAAHTSPGFRDIASSWLGFLTAVLLACGFGVAWAALGLSAAGATVVAVPAVLLVVSATLFQVLYVLLVAAWSAVSRRA